MRAAPKTNLEHLRSAMLRVQGRLGALANNMLACGHV